MAKILILEDSKEQMKVQIGMMQQLGHAVCATSGTDIEDVLQNFQPDIVLSDYDLSNTLPGLKGPDLLAEVNWTGPVLFHTNGMVRLVESKVKLSQYKKESAFSHVAFMPKQLTPEDYSQSILTLLENAGIDQKKSRVKLPDGYDPKGDRVNQQA